MEYKTELHSHSTEISRCAKINVRDSADQYIAAGYTTVVLTNHYCDYGFDITRPWEDAIKRFLDPIHEMQAYAGDRLTVLPGAEVRNYESINDYLILGATEDFFKENRYLFRQPLRVISRLVRESGALFIQAHPFRDGMQITTPSLLDGIEIFNGASGHQSRNQFANAWAKDYGMIRTSGSDYHAISDSISGGILTDTPIRTPEDIRQTLRSGNYRLVCEGPAAKRDGMQTMSAKE